MIDPIILSETNADEAKITFANWVSDMYTLIVVTGTHPEALQALSVSNELVNSGYQNYNSTRVIHALRPEFILPVLMQLKVNPEAGLINWSDIRQYAVLSISNKFNHIGFIFRNEDFRDEQKGKINYLILQAQAIDSVDMM